MSEVQYKSQDTRARIVETARSLIESIGVESLTVRDLAREAGVSPALIIQYFGSKDSLYVQIFDEQNQALMASLADLALEAREKPDLPLHHWYLQTAGILFDRDLSNRSLTKAIMAHTWIWSKENEDGFRTQLFEILASLVEIIQIKAPNVPAQASLMGVATFFTTYTYGLRFCLFDNLDKDDGLMLIDMPMKIIADGLIAQGTNGT